MWCCVPEHGYTCFTTAFFCFCFCHLTLLLGAVQVGRHFFGFVVCVLFHLFCFCSLIFPVQYLNFCFPPLIFTCCTVGLKSDCDTAVHCCFILKTCSNHLFPCIHKYILLEPACEREHNTILCVRCSTENSITLGYLTLLAIVC